MADGLCKTAHLDESDNNKNWKVIMKEFQGDISSLNNDLTAYILKNYLEILLKFTMLNQRNLELYESSKCCRCNVMIETLLQILDDRSFLIFNGRIFHETVKGIMPEFTFGMNNHSNNTIKLADSGQSFEKGKGCDNTEFGVLFWELAILLFINDLEITTLHLESQYQTRMVNFAELYQSEMFETNELPNISEINETLGSVDNDDLHLRIWSFEAQKYIVCISIVALHECVVIQKFFNEQAYKLNY
ncbi:hypothetical protein RhiirA1_452937 [Rhizophagus irregularis]|uniref:Uncharacterized protein n=1 Tax=Rhizophagus irregularis TaxID=588596 RepID=A0A2N0S8T7_9GLOM|nr:hypothetical protein RhiirA1_452937 [Rhizophagus irregularis]